MGVGMSQVSQLSNRAIAPLAFLAPQQKSYTANPILTYVYTIGGDKIAVSHIDGDGNMVPLSQINVAKEPLFVLFSHGNADDIGTCKSYSHYIAQTTNSIVVNYDYVNYGLSTPGETSELNMQQAITAVYEYMTQTLHIPSSKILIMGKSLGTAPSIHLAAKDFMDDILGVLLVSPLASGVRAVVPDRMVKSNMLNYLDNVFCPSMHYISFIRVPVFIIHGKQDNVINVKNAEILAGALHKAAYYPPLYLHGRHNDIEMNNPETFKSQVQAFVNTCFSTQRARNDDGEGKTSLVEYWFFLTLLAIVENYLFNIDWNTFKCRYLSKHSLVKRLH